MEMQLSTAVALAALVLTVQAAPAQESQPIGRAAPLSREETQKAVDNGVFCTDPEGHAYSHGAVLRSGGKTYRCVKAYDSRLEAQVRLVWVELVERKAEFGTAP